MPECSPPALFGAVVGSGAGFARGADDGDDLPRPVAPLYLPARSPSQRGFVENPRQICMAKPGPQTGDLAVHISRSSWITAACSHSCNGRAHTGGGWRSKRPASVPEWLMPLHAQRLAGNVPARRWVIFSLGVALARRYPWLAVPHSWRPGNHDNMSAVAGLDIEIAIDDAVPGAVVRGLAQQVLAANPRRLLIQTFGRYPALIILKGDAQHGA